MSSQDVPNDIIGVNLSHQIEANEERCLGVNWIISNNSVNKIHIKSILTLRARLMFHAKPYHPLGLVLLTRMIGKPLFCETVQSLNEEQKMKFLGKRMLRTNLEEEVATLV